MNYEKLEELRQKFEPIILDLAQYHLKNEMLKFEYPAGSITFEFK